MPVKKTVFVSSVRKNLEPHRAAVCRAIDGLDGFRSDGMEHFGSRDCDSASFCIQRVSECDVYVCILGPSYGTRVPNSEKSFTRLEFDTAVDEDKPRLLFFTKPDFPISAGSVESDDDRRLQNEFLELAKKERQGAIFTEPEELAKLVLQALANLGSTAEARSGDRSDDRNEGFAPNSTILLFPFVTNQAGYDSGISISNISLFPGSSVFVAGICRLFFYGSPKMLEKTTPSVAAGSSYVNTVSSLYPGFQGHVLAECPFPARGFAFISDGYGQTGRGLSQGYLAEVVTAEQLKSDVFKFYRNSFAGQKIGEA